ncbi:hypothetical protein [Streptomyces aureus]|uniref:hypothetical protein n=1 Tax=Streptomyces aureus TaxID=193461 RepID=UPI00055C9411|nr:hypothetical protein [Streptomyces aureus]
MNVVAGILSRVESTGADETTLIRDAVRRVLAEPVSRLVTDASRVAVEAAAHWDLPDGDLLPAPITVDDLPEVLRPYHQGLHKPAVSFFSSSVARYVETAWRWHAALGVLRQIEEPEVMAGEAEHLRHHDHLYSLVELVTEAVGRIDPVAEGEGLTSVWIELILGNSF